MLDKRVEILRGIGIERRSQNTAIAQRPRTEFHPAVHPGDDAMLVDLGYCRFDQLPSREQVSKAQLAVLQYLLDLLGAEARAQAQVPDTESRGLTEDVMPAVE